ncbi:hypothetical protein [Staphylococcus chromogenes]|uniref:hypothetical protein n=1 Tax=Staphylococcus chromogenes TaxID=46126 RepID=UPI000D1A7B75|nr:hypothetical protein [Staphylococcus chromogenes]PTF74835.1 hypothetical protein BU686_10975 [Staphylococcus chromogenes]PTG57175.1 hypothetical protein BU682_11115 [Staphylococcus chromogenes]RIM13582.1 hypothetical protein BU681_10810 [Staphylococcus chromogenes]
MQQNHAFNGNASVQQVASQIGGDLVKRFAPDTDVGGLVNPLTIKINAIANASDGFGEYSKPYLF